MHTGFLVISKKPKAPIKLSINTKSSWIISYYLWALRKKQEVVGGREKIVSYKRDKLEVVLDIEIAFNHNRIYGTNFSFEPSDSAEMKSNLIQTLDKWLAENQ